MGDIFASPPTATYCGGRGFGSNIVAGRIGDDSGATKPYKAMKKIAPDPSGLNRCDQICSRDSSGDGYLACNPIGDKGITVWRQFTSTPTFSFDGDKHGFISDGSTVPSTLSLSNSTSEHIHGRPRPPHVCHVKRGAHSLEHRPIQPRAAMTAAASPEVRTGTISKSTSSRPAAHQASSRERSSVFMICQQVAKSRSTQLATYSSPSTRWRPSSRSRR